MPVGLKRKEFNVMKKVVIISIFGFLFLNSCTTYKAGLATLDKPIRISSFSMLIEKNSPIIKKNNGIVNFEFAYRYMIYILDKDLPLMSIRVKEETGFPLDIDRFIAEFKETALLNLKINDYFSDNYTIEWVASTDTIAMIKSGEALASIRLSKRVITIAKYGSRNEKIHFHFNY